jgi:hypothetical protein
LTVYGKPCSAKRYSRNITPKEVISERSLQNKINNLI